MGGAPEQAMDPELTEVVREVTWIVHQYVEDPETSLDLIIHEGNTYLFTIVGHRHHGKPRFRVSRRTEPISSLVQVWEVEVIE
jgi:hypothetical protein